jgi:hypothetical protein
MAEQGFDADIKRMQDLFGVLKHEYDLYFAGTRKAPPTKERAEIDRLVRYYSSGTLNRLSQQFLFNSFTSKYSIHCEQWNKWLKAKEEGLVADPRFTASTMKAKKELYELEKAAPGQVPAAARAETEAPAPAARAESAKGGVQNQHLRRLYDELINARLQVGMVPEWDFAAFERHVKQQREAILAKYEGKDVIFSVQSKDGKVSLKAKIVK